MGLFFVSRRHFWLKQVQILEMYLQEPQPDPKALTSIKQFLRAAGLTSEVPPKVPVAFKCPELGLAVHSPCQNRTCHLWGDFPKQLNCIGNYTRQLERSQLSVAEMAIFSGYSRMHIHNVLHGAMRDMRKAALPVIRAETFGSPKLRRPSKDCHCGRRVEAGDVFPHAGIEGLVYCSFDCWIAKPPLIRFFGDNFGVDLTSALAHLPRRYHSLEEAARCLTVDERSLESVLWVHADSSNFLADKDRPALEPRTRGKKFWERLRDQMAARAA